jgi:hypothetical protein
MSNERGHPGGVIREDDGPEDRFVFTLDLAGGDTEALFQVGTGGLEARSDGVTPPVLCREEQH